MRAGKRLAIAIWAAGLMLAPAPLVAQSVPEATTGTPAADAIGPKELKNFSLSGTVTRPADQPPQRAATASSPARTATSTASSESTRSLPRPARQASAEAVRAASSGSEPPPARALETQRQAAALPSIAVAPPVDSSGHARSTAPAPQAASFVPEPAGAGTLAPEHGLLLWPWLLAALALGAGGAFLLWRNRSREAFAGGPAVDAFLAPGPAPVPRPKAPERAAAPAPVPPRAAPPLSGGVVSSRLRPWLEVTMLPIRCIVDEAQVAFEFELELFNSGNAPARAVLVEANVFNAGAAQDQEISAFFAEPIGQGERIDSIPPLQRLAIRTQVVAPRENIQVLEIAGRHVFVPLIAFNALYRWSAAEGQTSVSYLLGRDTKSEKLAPFRLDLGPRVFRGVGARQLPTGVRN